MLIIFIGGENISYNVLLKVLWVTVIVVEIDVVSPIEADNL